MTKSKKAQATAVTTASGTEQFIPLNLLKKSPRNARKTPHPAADIEALAASIAAHGMLQAPVVEPEMNGDKPTGSFLVTIGEGRRQAQLLRAKRKEIAKNEPIRCLIDVAHDAFEISLAENAIRSDMHPADQFDAFFHLHTEKGQSAEDIAARFGVTPAVVKQRLKLAAISPRLIQAYRDGELALDQLTAFAITDDQARQERVFDNLHPHDDRGDILAALNDDHVPASDPRAVFVGSEAYRAAGGAILGDLFAQDGAGYFTDAALLADLAYRKLEEAAATVKAEGWKWVEVMPRFDYSAVDSCRRIYARERELTEDEQQQLADLEDEYAQLEEGGDTEAVDAEIERLDAAMEALNGKPVFDADEIARAGAVVTLSHDGRLSVQRGYVRPEDDLARQKPRIDGAGASAALSEKLTAELTAHRTAHLRNALAQDAAIALRAVLHSLTGQAFYRPAPGAYLGLRLVPVQLERHAPGISESEPEQDVAKRHGLWAHRLPEDEKALWDTLGSFSLDEQLELLAHCASLALDAVQPNRQASVPTVGPIVRSLNFDMAAHWSPTAANYLGRISKDRILDAVREGVSPEAAENLADLKKDALAVAAEERLADKRWLPEILRTAA